MRGRAVAIGVVAAALAGCGDGGVLDTADRCKEPGPRAPVYEVDGDAKATAEVICGRASRGDYDDAAVKAIDATHVALEIPRERGAAESLLSPFELRFYDWEANVFSDPSRGGPGPTAFSGLFPAVEFAAKQKPRAEDEDVPPGLVGADNREYDRRNDSTGDQFFLFGPGEGPTRPLIRPGASRREEVGLAFESCEQIVAEYGASVGGASGTALRVPADSDCRDELRSLGDKGPAAGSTVVRVPRGITLLRGEDAVQPPPTSRAPQQYYVVEDDVELTGADILDPEHGFDPNVNAPNVSFEFTARGQVAFENVTKRISQRGLLRNTRQNFTITLDAQIVSTAYIDPGRYPEGIDGSNGAEISGVGDSEDAEELADLLAIGPLPAPVTRVR